MAWTSISTWAWGILGMALLAVEMLIGTFYVLWFGIAGLLMAVVVSTYPMISMAWQIFIYAGFSLASLFVWHHYNLYSAKHDLRVGQSRGEEIGRTGVIIEAVSPHQTGKIQFATGVMGSREWMAIADASIAVGSTAEIVGIEGNILRVRAMT